MINSISTTPLPTTATQETRKTGEKGDVGKNRPTTATPLTTVEESTSGGKATTPTASHVTLSAPNTKGGHSLDGTYNRMAALNSGDKFDWLSLLLTLIQSELATHQSERKERKADLSSQVSALKDKSKDIKKEANMELISGCVQGAAEIGAGVAQGVGGARGLKAMRGASDAQAGAALSQSTQMRYTAVSDTISAGGKMGSSTATYEETEAKAKETEDETAATKAGTYVSQDSEDMQNIWSMQQAVLQTIKEINDTHHQTAEKSHY